MNAPCLKAPLRTFWREVRTMYLSDAERRPGWIHGSSAATVSWHVPAVGLGPQGRSLAKLIRVTGVVSDPITRNYTRSVVIQSAIARSISRRSRYLCAFRRALHAVISQHARNDEARLGARMLVDVVHGIAHSADLL